jgi:NHL repeat
MQRTGIPSALLAVVVLLISCTTSPTRNPTQTPTPPAEVPRGTPNAPTAPPGSTPIPWWGTTIANLDINPRWIGKSADLAVAPDGSLYVADIGGHRILHIEDLGKMNGKVLHSWGRLSNVNAGAEAAGGTFNEPWGLAVTEDTVYVADTWNHRIQAFTPQGAFIRSWGKPGQGSDPNLLYGPRDLVVNPQGFVIVSDTGNKRLVVYSRDGDYVNQIGGEGSALGQFNEPVGLALTPENELLVADQGNRRVQVLTIGEDGSLTPRTDWPVEAWAHLDLLYKPYICVAGSAVFITDTENGSILEYTRKGEYRQTYNLNTTGYLNYGLTYGISADRDGNLWVSDLAGGAGVLVKIIPLR